MVTVLRTESGTQILSANLQKTIQSIREIVGNHSDSEIYNALKENNMDPNETAQKLLYQDPFHEVRRRRDKKKESAVYNGYVDPRKRSEYLPQGAKVDSSDRNARRGGYTRRAVYDAGISREFRVVRDNRVNQNSDREVKASPQVSSSVNVEQSIYGRGVSVPSNHQRHFGGRYIQSPTGGADFRPKRTRDVNPSTRKEHLDERRSVVRSSPSQVSMMKSADSQNPSSSNTVGVYASASDPVHVPSPDSRSSAAIGAIRREVGVVGSRQHSSESTSQLSSKHSTSNLNSVVRSSSSNDSVRPMGTVSRSDQTHASVVEPAMISSAGSRLGNHFSNRLHQQTVGHQKGPLPSKEWKPKTSQKSAVRSLGVIGSPVKSASKAADDSKNADREADVLENKLSQVNIHESQNVIIAEHIRVPETDRFRLTFGSFVVESDEAENSASAVQSSESAEEAAPETSPRKKQMTSVDDQVQRSHSGTPSSEAPEDRLPEYKVSSGVHNTQDYSDVGLVHSSPSFTPSKLQQSQDPTDLPNFSASDPQPAYDMPYFRPSVDDTVGGPGLPSPQEAQSSHIANGIPGTSMAMMQQQAHIAQMYPQLHLSHYTNVMPYRQFLPPMYVPPMVPGYSGNPGYSHLSNGSNYVLMPSGSSHLTPNNLKYGVQQFKSLPAGTPAGFCNFANPTAYAINAPGVVGGPIGLEDTSRLKYKDSNPYAANPQAETSEVWIQNQREIGGIQSTPYFNMQQGQTAAYLQSHPGHAHASFNAAAMAQQQSSHMQFPGMYPPQPAVGPNSHHNIGVGVGPGAQVGAFQQPQISHLNWTPNF